jgi:hypothetical protein
MNSRARVVVRVRQIAEDQAAGHVALAEGEAAAAARRAEDAQSRTHVHPVAGLSGQFSAAALAASAGSAAALMANAHTASEAAARAMVGLNEARRQAAVARSARMAAERLAERREELVAVELRRGAQRTVDEMVSARHRKSA